MKNRIRYQHCWYPERIRMRASLFALSSGLLSALHKATKNAKTL